MKTYWLTSAQIIIFNQRGAGKSTPSACLEENTTWDLVKDIERIREKLKVDKWHVFGGSWVRCQKISMVVVSPSILAGLDSVAGLCTGATALSNVNWLNM
jgi:pimeloyl-ACP methyl ester carboxylesterase